MKGSVHLDGGPLDHAAPHLPLRSRLKPALALPLQVHIAAQKRLAGRPGTSMREGRRFPRSAAMALRESLKGEIRGGKRKPLMPWPEAAPRCFEGIR